MSQTTTPQPVVTVQNSFVLGPDGLPQFFPTAFEPVPDGAENLTFTQRLLWSQNLNLRWFAPLAAPVVPSFQFTTLGFFNLHTMAERLAIAALETTSPAVAVGVDDAQLLGVVDLTNPATVPWFGLIQAANVYTPDRLTYILAGVPPTPAQTAASDAAIAAMQAAAAAGSGASASNEGSGTS